MVESQTGHRNRLRSYHSSDASRQNNMSEEEVSDALIIQLQQLESESLLRNESSTPRRFVSRRQVGNEGNFSHARPGSTRSDYSRIVGRVQPSFRNQIAYWKIPGLYSLFSTLLAAIAIISSQQAEKNYGDGHFLGSWWISSGVDDGSPETARPLVVRNVSSSGTPEEPLEHTFKMAQTPLPSTCNLEMEMSCDIALNNWTKNYSLHSWLRGRLHQFESILVTSSPCFQTVPNVIKMESNTTRWNYQRGSSRVAKKGKGSSQGTESISETNSVSSRETADANKQSFQNDNSNIANKTQNITKVGNNKLFLLTLLPHGSKRELINRTNNLLLQNESNFSWWISMLDPTLLNPTETTLPEIVDKIQKSTPRLLAIANLFLALTFLLHQAVADWFLGTGASTSRRRRNESSHNSVPRLQEQIFRQQHQAWDGSDWTSGRGNFSAPVGGRERLGGVLVFKLLLISAVVAPDTVDLFILLSWYTLLSFLRSLVVLCAQSNTRASESVYSRLNIVHTALTAETTNTADGGNIHLPYHPHNGVLHLLITVLIWDVMAAAFCVALFHGAGVGMVLLLTCDCAILAFDICCEMLQYWLVMAEMVHLTALRSLEGEQYEHMQNRTRVTPQQDTEFHVGGRSPIQRAAPETQEVEGYHERDEALASAAASTDVLLQVDRHMELLEQMHAKRVNMLESSVFWIQVLSQCLTIAHFSHIWSLHGLQMTLIDGVLALQLHSAVAAASQRITIRRNIRRREVALNSQFEDASVADLEKAAASGDVCSICYCTMSVLDSSTSSVGSQNAPEFTPLSLNEVSEKSGWNRKRYASTSSCCHVKKLGCGHMYHTACLREVVERSRCLEKERCALCRAPLIHGKQHSTESVTHSDLDTVQNADSEFQERISIVPVRLEPEISFVSSNDGSTNNVSGISTSIIPVSREQPDPLFRFSTEGLFPSWIPLPAFSLEVVRRPIPHPPLVTTRLGRVNDDVNNEELRLPLERSGIDHNQTSEVLNQNRTMQEEQDQRSVQQSLFHRFLVAAGITTNALGPEEEEALVDQLSDMFPQFHRLDLRECLRQRGSAQSVVEVILTGLFPVATRAVEASADLVDDIGQHVIESVTVDT